MYRAMSRSLRKLRSLLDMHEVGIEHELSFFPRVIKPHSSSSIQTFDQLFLPCILKPYFQTELPLSLETPRATEVVLKTMQDGLTMCFQLMRQINYRINLLSDEDYQKKPEVIRHRVGQIFRHRKFNYWGVIVGYDEICQQSSTWKQKNGVKKLRRGAEQPFYRTVFIEKDDEQDVEHQVRCGYAPQENIIIDHAFTLDDVTHPTLQQMFPAINPEIGCFEVGEDLSQLYPDDAYWVFVQSQYAPHSSRIVFPDHTAKDVLFS